MLARIFFGTSIVLLGLFFLPSARPLDVPGNGTIVRVNERGDTVFVANYRKNKLHGIWNSWYPNKQVCDSGRLENAAADGVWKGWYPNGVQRFEYHFNAQKLSAVKDEMRRQPKIKYYVLSSMPPSQAAWYYHAKNIFGIPTAASSEMLLSKQIHHKAYAPEALEAVAKLNAAQGDKQYHPPFAEGLLHGSYTRWNPDGSLLETGLYLNGLREGMWEIYKEGQVKGVGTYKHGKPFGEWRYYSPEGRVLYWKRYDAKGTVSEEHHFKARP
jgi:antitoxin component YwqK of YwqJK toxin-antitoxin module